MAIIKKFRIKSFKQKNFIIEFENISLSYGSRLILDNISFKISENTIFGMLGPNGVGKSTIFNLMTGLIPPKNGKIIINNTDATNYPVYMRTKKFKLSYCPQYGGYFNDLTLIDNLKAISEIVIENKKIRSDRINFLLSRFELENLKDIKAKYLSGGQRRKLVIALALLDLLACVDVAMILSNGKIVAQDTPSNLVKNINAKNAYFGDSFKFN